MNAAALEPQMDLTVDRDGFLSVTGLQRVTGAK